jgi:DICT domain-containing protein
MDHATQLNALIDAASKSFSPNKTGPTASPMPASNNFFTTSVLGMEAISHVIEEQALKLNQPFKFYSAFQKFSRFKHQQERYRKLVATKNPIYIFGEPDTEIWQTENLIKINLDAPNSSGQGLANYWFVVLHSPDFVSMALVAHEVHNPNFSVQLPNRLVFRNYEGFWTYDKTIIGQVVEILDGYIQQHNQGLVLKSQIYSSRVLSSL